MAAPAVPELEPTSAAVSFRAMGTDVRVVVNPGEAVERCGARVRAWFETVEVAASRFRDDSELNRLARDPEVQPSDVLAALHRQAAVVFRVTEGLVTPYTRVALEQAGYGKSFEQIGEGGSPPLQEGRARTFWGELDFGGIGKGWAVGRALALIEDQCEGALIDAGGDVGVVGRAKGDGIWWVDVERPGWGDVGRVGLRGGGVATSSVLRRAWDGPDGPAHHLIDPRTGLPSRGDIVQATVWARSPLWAEVAAKCLVIRGSAYAPTLRSWLPEAVLAWTTDTGAFIEDAALREEVLSCRAR